MRAKPPPSPAVADGAPPKRAVPLKDQAYGIIKHQIITCRFAPGEKLNEAQVAERLGLSRMPVHHALAQLSLEGLVTIRPRKGVEVRPVDLGELLQIIDARTVNECRCARLAARQASEAELAAMADVLRRSEAALARHDTEALMLLDREFHDLIARASRSAIFCEILQRLHDRAVRFWFISLTEADHQAAVLREHAAIHRALAARDAVAAARAMARHIEAFRRNVMLLLGTAPGEAVPARRPMPVISLGDAPLAAPPARTSRPAGRTR